MSRFFRSCLNLALVLIIHLVSAVQRGGQTADSHSQVTVCIYNQAQASQSTIYRAREMAVSLFRQAGINTMWLYCSPDLNDVQSPACRSGIGPAYLSLRINPGPAGAQSSFLKSATGFAALTPNQRGVDASVFYRRVEEIANKQHISGFRILGIAMAHEIGHLLLGSNSHSPTGIMRPTWKWEELVPGGTFLGFTPEESRKMRADVSARLKQQAVFKTSGFEPPK